MSMYGLISTSWGVPWAYPKGPISMYGGPWGFLNMQNQILTGASTSLYGLLTILIQARTRYHPGISYDMSGPFGPIGQLDAGPPGPGVTRKNGKCINLDHAS